ncbi:MAG TPA: 50S ribosomal protein L25 [Candidatus Methylomirabilis sp.]|nr:50S ribosomal protein L25 [Candidatus Methylomirabilis sp.]
MATVDLKGQVRTTLGKEGSKRLRRALRIPGIVYGGPHGTIPVVVNPQELLSALGAGENVLINLSLSTGAAAEEFTVILKQLQVDPVKGRPLHADFQEISMERKIRVEVPLVLTGESVGVKGKGGILEQPLRQLFVECLPLAIPEKIVVDVSALDIGNAVHVRDLTVDEGIRILEDGARVVASVVAPAAEEVAAVVEEEKPAEPEVVGKKEKEVEEAEAEGKPKAEAKPKAEGKPK